MRKRFILSLIFLLSAAVILFQTVPTYGRYYFLDRKLAVDGYIQNQSSYRLGGESLVSCENRFVVEADYAPFPNLSFYGSWRSLYDAVWDIRHDHGKFWDRYAHSGDRLEQEQKLREFYGVIGMGKLNLRVGQQQIVWGESDGVRLMDIINPLDMRRQFVARDWSDIRRTMPALRATYDIDPVRNWFLECVWIPDWKKDLIDVGDPVIEPDYNGPWSIPLPSLTFTPWGAPVIPSIKEDKKTRFSLNSSQYGGRMGIEIRGWFITLNYFHRFNHVPSTEFHGATPLWMGPTGPSLIPEPRPPDLIMLNLLQRYYSMNIAGFTFNKSLGNLFILRGEFALYPDEPVSSLNQAEHTDMVTRKARLHSMLGFDAKQWIRWLNPQQMISFSGQVFNFYTFDHEWGLVEGPYNQKLHQSTVFVSLKVNTDYNNARISPDFLVVYDTTNSGWFLKPRVEFKYGDHWRPEIGALVFQGSGYKLPFNIMNPKDEFYFRLKYLF
ncbi:MAG: DUF1302 family protein [Pseudomonadota bacterium]